MTYGKNHVATLFNLTGKTAIVTGGVQGLGWQATEALLEAGASVVITSRSQQKAEEKACLLSEQTGGTCLGTALEVSDEGSWEALVALTMEHFGSIDILVNNAGGRKVTVTPPQSDFVEGYLDKRPLEDWNYSIAAMQTGVFLGCRAVAPIMKRQRAGKIVNIASIDGIRGRDLRIYENAGLSPTVPDYLACKAAVINFTKGIAVVLAPYGICVNSISPGGFYRGQPDQFVKNYSHETPLGRMGDDTRDLKGAVLFACAPASDYMVGHNLVIDGGFTVW